MQLNLTIEATERWLTFYGLSTIAVSTYWQIYIPLPEIWLFPTPTHHPHPKSPSPSLPIAKLRKTADGPFRLRITRPPHVPLIPRSTYSVREHPEFKVLRIRTHLEPITP